MEPPAVYCYVLAVFTVNSLNLSFNTVGTDKGTDEKLSKPEQQAAGNCRDNEGSEHIGVYKLYANTLPLGVYDDSTFAAGNSCCTPVQQELCPQASSCKGPTPQQTLPAYLP